MGSSTASRTPPKTASRARAGCLADDLCAEHKALARQLSLFDAVAEKTEAASTTTLRRDVDRAYVLLAERFLPHAHAEHGLRTRLATRDHRHIREAEDHGEIERLTARLSTLRDELRSADDEAARREIRHLLYELHALTRLHFADELLPDAGAEDR